MKEVGAAPLVEGVVVEVRASPDVVVVEEEVARFLAGWDEEEEEEVVAEASLDEVDLRLPRGKAVGSAVMLLYWLLIMVIVDFRVIFQLLIQQCQRRDDCFASKALRFVMLAWLVGSFFTEQKSVASSSWNLKDTLCIINM